MATANVFTKDLEPFTPDIDARRLQKTGIIDGKNFLFDVDGPRSAFGSKFADYNYITKPGRYKLVELPVGDQFFYGTPEGIFRRNPVSLSLEPILTVTVTNSHWPWTAALVGNIYYFAQYNVGLWQYNAVTGTIALLDTPVGFNVIGVCASYARLVCLNEDLVMWSSLDDGTDFIPSLRTGAGAQALSMVGGTPYRVDPVSDGFVVATNKGLLKGENVQADFIWRFYVLSEDVKIFSPSAGVKLPDVGVIYLDNSGFHATTGSVPQPWEGDMGTFVKDGFLAKLDRRKIGCLALYYSQAARMLFVSFSARQEEGRMAHTLVYYLPSNKWGKFDTQHFGVFETYDSITHFISTCSYMGTDGYIREFQPDAYNEIGYDGQRILRDFIFRPTSEPKILLNQSPSGAIVYLGITKFVSMDVDPTPFAPIQNIKINQVVDGDVLPFSLPQVGLNSVIDIGMFRFSQQVAADETSFIQNVIIGSKKGIVNYTSENLNTEDGSEDYNDETGEEDLGTWAGISNQFKLELLDTNDGFSHGPVGWYAPMKVNEFGASTYYSPDGMSSIYHRMRLTAANVGESYALKTIDLAGTLTGRLM